MGFAPPVVTTMITTGVTNTLAQNVIYALPSKSIWLQSSAVIQTSLDGTNFSDVAASTTGVHIVAPFVKNSNTSTGIILMAKIIS